MTVLLPLGEPNPIDELPEIELARELFDARTRMSLSSHYGVGRNYMETLGGETSWAADLDLPDYFYEIEVPPIAEATLDHDYTVLLRVVNPIGLPVTEEQEIRLRMPANWIEQAPEHCEMIQEVTASSE